MTKLLLETWMLVREASHPKNADYIDIAIRPEPSEDTASIPPALEVMAGK